MNRQNKIRYVKKKKSGNRTRKTRIQPVMEFTAIKQNPETQRSMRFLGSLTALNQVAIGFRDLGQLMMTCVSGSTAGFTALSAFKLQSVSCTLLPSIDEEGLFSFTWDGSNGTTSTSRVPSVTRTIPYAPSNAARMTFFPPEDSFAGMWVDQSQFALTDTMFTVVATSTLNVVLDLHFSYVLGYENNARTYTFLVAPTYSGIVAGRIGRDTVASGALYTFVPAEINSVQVVGVL